MFGIKRQVIAQHERGLYLKDRSIVKILEPGVYWIVDPLDRVKIEVYDITEPAFAHAYVDVLIKDRAALCEKYFQRIELGEFEVGLVYKNDKLATVLAPATRQLYWEGPVDVRVEVQDIASDFEIPCARVRLIANARGNELAMAVRNTVYPVEVAEQSVGLLFVDGELVKTLQPGLYAFWKYNRTVKVEQVDTRLQAMEVSGQEILTKDKVSLRANLAAQYQIADPVTAVKALVDITGTLYRELQFALRASIGTRTLDTLLGDKGELDRVVFETVRDKVAEYGVVMKSVGVKDVILPGEMKEILNQVVQAEKAAQANIIKRREETAATRSLLNTARLMDENPVLLRLKELEALEKITEKVDKLTVFGGLDGVMREMVKIHV
ncbi:MAG: slipin family protein [Candidatus Thiodiazotropha sp. (ex Dulcina madagascariensis)]|nr:slipin family protein [Candidatus Thiodiazotropha sp. (ex Dulcina madagascariensis)]